MMHPFRSFAATTLVAALCAPPALAADPPGPPPAPPHGPPHGGPQMGESMKEIRAQLLRKEAGLDDAAAAKAEKVLEGLADDRHKAHRAVGEATRALRDLSGSDSKDETAYKKAIDAVVAAHRGVQDLRARELEELRKVLSQRECAKVILALERIQHAMRGEMRKARKAWLKAELQRMDDGDDDGPPDPPAPPPPPGRVPPPPRKGK